MELRGIECGSGPDAQTLPASDATGDMGRCSCATKPCAGGAAPGAGGAAAWPTRNGMAYAQGLVAGSVVAVQPGADADDIYYRKHRQGYGE